jgi:hypothetical protein
MENYKNLSGRSGVASFQIGNDNITVRFKDGGEYIYSNGSAGVSSIATMKELATNGSGLNTFINTHVKENYESKN